MAQFATRGTGNMKNYICWFDWAGISIADNVSKTFTTPDGLTVKVAFSNVTGPAVVPSVMNTWSGAILWQLYDFTDPSIKPALFSENTLSSVTFTMDISVTRAGVSTPFTLVTADAEASATSEITTINTNGSPWRTIEFYRNSNQTSNPVSGCGTQTVKLYMTYGDAPQTGQNPILATDGNGSLTIATAMNRQELGGMALAFGIFAPVDRGDLPAPYPQAQHGLRFTTNNSCNFNSPFPSIAQDASLRLGSVPGDADGAQTSDDNATGVDEDAVSSFPLYSGSGIYTIPLKLSNSTGAPAFLNGWFDYNRDGNFTNNESVSVIVPNGATSASVTWTGLPANLPKGTITDFGFRFRLSSDAAEVQSPGGYAKGGEVEDYLIDQKIIRGQDVQVSFTAPDTVCVNTPVKITNTSINASSYYWNFCVANSTTNPVGTNLGNFGFNLSVFIDYAKEGNNYYAFVTNNMPGKLVRLDFGNSLLNTPVAYDFGNLGGAIPDYCEGIQLVKNENKWYAIIVGGKPTGQIVKVEFGTSLSNNAPVVTNWGNIGNLAFPTDLHLFQDGANWYGLTISAQNNTITRFNFTNSFSNVPTGMNLGNIGSLNYPTGIYAISKNNNWYAFVVNAGSGVDNSTNASLSRLDFGSSLLNTPTGVNLGNPGNTLRSPRDITILQSCNEIFGFVVNYSSANDIVRLNFSNSLTTVPAAVSLGNTGNLSFPHCISKLFRVENDLYSFVTNVNNNTITLLKFQGCNSSTVASSTLQDPPPVIYNVPGTYNINLTVDDGLPTQAATCKQVVVVAPPVHSPIKTITVCGSKPVRIGSATPYSKYLWNTGATTDSIDVTSSGLYWVETSRGGCSARDSFMIDIKGLCDSIKITGANKVCSKYDTVTYSIYKPSSCSQQYNIEVDNAFASIIFKDATSLKLLFRQEGRTTIKVTYDNDCKIVANSLEVAVQFSPNKINLGQDVISCGDTSFLLNAGEGFVSYQWQDGTTTPDFFVNAPGVYTILAQNFCGDQFKDTIRLTNVFPIPFAVVPLTATVCEGDSLELKASGGTSYSWSPFANFNHPDAASVKALVDVSQNFSVSIIDSVCLRDTVITIPVSALPSAEITISKSNDVNCSNDSAILIANGGLSYVWTPDLYITRSNNGRITVKPPKTITYYVQSKNADGCWGKDSVTVYFSKIGEQKLYMPNAFTPNGDGLNDIFRPTFIGPAAHYDFKIYNRWGQLIFRTSTPGVGWDGRFNGVVQRGDVYVFYLTAEGDCNGKFEKKGTFILIR